MTLDRYEWRDRVVAHFGLAGASVIAAAYALTEHGEVDLTSVRPGRARLAAMLGATPRAVYRNLVALRDAGFVSWRQAGRDACAYAFAIPDGAPTLKDRVEAHDRTPASARTDASARTLMVVRPDVDGSSTGRRRPPTPSETPSLTPSDPDHDPRPDANVRPDDSVRPDADGTRATSAAFALDGAPPPRPSPAAAAKAEAAAVTARVITHLNARAGRRFEVAGPKAGASVALVAPLLRAGWTEADLMAVVDSKCAEWAPGVVFANGEPATKYLTPETLFGRKKFASYVEAARNAAARGPNGTPRRRPDPAAHRFAQAADGTPGKGFLNAPPPQPPLPPGQGGKPR